MGINISRRYIEFDPIELEERVMQFSRMQLPGQPKSMHLGSLRLVNDMWELIKHMLTFAPRAVKLALKKEPFLVVGQHEPYYLNVYLTIRHLEQKQRTWTQEDEATFRRLTKGRKLYKY